MEIAPTIDGARLRRAREGAGLTQHELAHRLGISGGERVSMWERGAARPRNPRLLHALAQALGVEPVLLLAPPVDGPDLRRLRFVAGLSVAEVAEAAHISVSTLKRWEAHGAPALPAATVAALAFVLRTSPHQIRHALSR